MLTDHQRARIKACAKNLRELDALINELRLSHPGKFHSIGDPRYTPGMVPIDRYETMITRRFIHQPATTDCYASHLRDYVPGHDPRPI